MVAQHYRWDFIGLSTDTKPTPSTSEKVTDGSTYYTSDNSKLYVWYKDQWYEKEVEGGGTTYTAGSGIDITDSTISVDTQTIQPKLTAGSNVTISDNTISATDTTYSNFTGTDGNTAGTAGLVPAPANTDADKFLKSDGTWATAGGGGGASITKLSSANFNYDGNTKVAIWLLSDGVYALPDSYTDVPVVGSDNSTSFNNQFKNGTKTFKGFIKIDNHFYFMVNKSSQDPSMKMDRPIYFCTISSAGWLATDDNYQHAKISELSS